MNSRQKAGVIAGLVCLLCTPLALPYQIVGTDGLPGIGPRVSMMVVRPFSNAPKPDRLQFIGDKYLWVRDVTLDTGRLALVWGGIVILTMAWLALASGTEKREPAGS